MIRKTKQNWTIGETVKVGFMVLRVKAFKAVKDYLPDLYLLESLDHQKFYEFIPHNGLAKLSRDEAEQW